MQIFWAPLETCGADKSNSRIRAQKPRFLASWRKIRNVSRGGPKTLGLSFCSNFLFCSANVMCDFGGPPLIIMNPPPKNTRQTLTNGENLCKSTSLSDGCFLLALLGWSMQSKPHSRKELLSPRSVPVSGVSVERVLADSTI